MRHLSLMVMGLTVALGCAGPRQDPILRLSAAEALESGKEYLEKGKYLRARRYLTHAFEVEPNSRGGREALLLAADAYYLDGGGPDNYIKCEAKYRDFLNRFPTSDRAAYAQYQVANCLAARMEKPDRDQKVTEKAQDAFNELVRLYPSSEYAVEAQQRLLEVDQKLAEHELAIAVFYLRYRNCAGSYQRIEYLRDRHPQFERMDVAIVTQGLAYRLCGENDKAETAFADLRGQFPQSPELEKLSSRDKKVQKLLARGLKKQERRMRRRGIKQPATTSQQPPPESTDSDSSDSDSSDSGTSSP